MVLRYTSAFMMSVAPCSELGYLCCSLENSVLKLFWRTQLSFKSIKMLPSFFYSSMELILTISLGSWLDRSNGNPLSLLDLWQSEKFDSLLNVDVRQKSRGIHEIAHLLKTCIYSRVLFFPMRQRIKSRIVKSVIFTKVSLSRSIRCFQISAFLMYKTTC